MAVRARVKIEYVDSEKLEDTDVLADADGATLVAEAKTEGERFDGHGNSPLVLEFPVSAPLGIP